MINKLKLIIIMYIILMVSSCNLFQAYTWMPPSDIDTMEKTQELMKQVQYKSDPNDKWQLPHYTYNKMQGDCEDSAALLASIFIYNLQYYDVTLVYCWNVSKNIAHMLVHADGVYYEGATGFPIAYTTVINQWNILLTIDYDRYIFLAKAKKLS